MFPRTVDFIICSSALACGGVGSGGGGGDEGRVHEHKHAVLFLILNLGFGIAIVTAIVDFKYSTVFNVELI